MACRQSEETVEGFARELRYLVTKAYPTIGADAQKALALNQFIAGLKNRVTRERVFVKRCKDLTEAVELAKLSEAAIQFSHASNSNNVLGMEPSPEGQ